MENFFHSCYLSKQTERHHLNFSDRSAKNSNLMGYIQEQRSRRPKLGHILTSNHGVHPCFLPMSCTYIPALAIRASPT